MSEPRKECYKCLYNQKCIPQADYKSIYCQMHRKFKMPIIAKEEDDERFKH